MTTDTLPNQTGPGTGFEDFSAAEVAEAIVRQHDQEIADLIQQRGEEANPHRREFLDRQIDTAHEVGSMAMRFADISTVSSGEDLMALLSGQGSRLRRTGQDSFVSSDRMADPRYRHLISERLVRLGATSVDELMTPRQEEAPGSLAERHPEWPKLKITYDLGPHGTREDFAGFAEKLADADVYIVEGGGQDADDKVAVLQDISNRDTAKEPANLLDNHIAENKLQGKQTEAVMRALYGTRKIVGSFDVRGADLAVGKEAIEASRNVQPDYSAGDFDTTIDDYADKVQRYALLQRKREGIIVANVEPEMERIFKEHPELLGKEEVAILAPMGKIHRTLVEDLGTGLGLDIDTNQPRDEDFTFRDDLQKFFMEGGTEPSRELKMRAYANHVVSEKLLWNLPAQGHKTDDIYAYQRYAVAGLDEVAIKYLFKTEMVEPLNPEGLDRLLRSRGLEPLPRTNEELEQTMLKIRDEQSSVT